MTSTSPNPLAAPPSVGPAASSRWRRRARWMVPVAVVLVGLFVFVMVYFQPHKAFIDDTVNEAAPVGVAVETAVMSGEFISRDHDTTGHAMIADAADGTRFLRIEDLDTDNGPDLKVYLTTVAPEADEDTFDDDFVDLGRLKGNVGDQNYEIAADIDITRYQSVVIWCDRFDVAFGAAPLG